MSLRSYQTKDGTRWQVQWRDGHAKLRGRTFSSKRDALAFDADVKARKHKGEALPRPGKEPLAVAYDEWYRLRGSTLATTTQRTYQAVWSAHVQGRFDHHSLNQLSTDPKLFEELLADMRERGVGNAAQRKVLVVMSAVLTAAVDWNKIATNPLWRMRKPPSTRQRIPRPFPPAVIERIRLRMQRRPRKSDHHALALTESCFVSLMAYAGLRPGEALALTWGDIGRTILVEKSLRDGAEAPTKTGAVRAVPLVSPLEDDLNELRMARGPRRPLDELVVPSHDGGYWSRAEYNNWRNRVWKPILGDLFATGPFSNLAHARPYDCRGSFVSLHLRAGASPLEVASWAGHSPAVMFRHYANVIEELKGQPIIDAVDQIIQARGFVLRMETRELDKLVEGLLDHPAGGALVADPTADRLIYT